MSLADRIARILRQHEGRENWISAREIAAQLRLPQRDGARVVRDEIAMEDWSEREMLISAIPGRGYFLAADYDEIAAREGVLAQLAKAAAAKLRAFRAARLAKGIHLKN